MFESNEERNDLMALTDLMDDLVGIPGCANDPDAYFVDGVGTQGIETVRMAKAMCKECPIRLQCLEFAMKHPQQGIWGGLSARERRQLKRAVSARSVSPHNVQGQSAPATKLQPSNHLAVQPSALEPRS